MSERERERERGLMGIAVCDEMGQFFLIHWTELCQKRAP